VVWRNEEGEEERRAEVREISLSDGGGGCVGVWSFVVWDMFYN
jgi:hypothetical protein